MNATRRRGALRIGKGMPKTHPHSRPNGKLRGGHLLPDGSREHRYSRELAEEILWRLATGETLAEICGDPAIGVSTGAVRQWDVDDRDGWFSAAYARARRQQVEAWSDDLLKIADDASLEPSDRRVRLDTRKWLMSKLHPHRYGDRVQVAGDRDSPIQHTIGVIDLSQLSGSELDALERFADARLTARDVQDRSD